MAKKVKKQAVPSEKSKPLASAKNKQHPPAEEKSGEGEAVNEVNWLGGTFSGFTGHLKRFTASSRIHT